MKVCGYPIGKIRNLLTFKEQSGGGVSYKIKETYRAREGNKFLKVPLFYILKEKVHSDSPVLQELGKRLRYQIGTNQAFFEKLPSSSVLTIDDNFKNNRDSEIPSHIKSKQEDKLRLLTSEVTKIISDNKLNLDNIKRNYVLQMLSEVLIPLIEKKSVQYEEMRKVFINLQKELEVFLNEMKSRRKRSENEIFRIISNINQAKRQQRDLESFTTVAAESEVNQKFDSVYTPRHKKCLYGTYPGKTTKKICTPNSQLDEFPIAILVKDEDKPKEIQNIPYISMSNSTKGSIKGHSSENENKRIALRNYTSDSKSTKKCIQDDLEQSFRSYNQEGGVGYFDNFQKHYIPRPITQTPKEQFTIPGESNFKRNSPKRKSKQFISDALKTTSRKEESTVNLKDNNSLAIVDDKNKPTFSQNSPYLTSKKKVDTTTARIPQATLSKAGMDNLKKLEQIVNPSQNEARLPFDDEVSTRSTALESKSLKRNISKQPSTMLSSKSDTKLSTELAMSKPVQPLRNFEPMPSLKNEWKPKKISKSISSPILKTVPAVSEKTPSTQLKCCEKSASISLLENCRGILENILRKLKGPPKRSLGSYRSEESISNYKGCDTASKENESESKSQSKLKYPWNHVVLTRNLNSGSKRAYSTTSRKYPYFKKDFFTPNHRKFSSQPEKSCKNRFPWKYLEAEPKENANCCQLTRKSYVDAEKISAAEPEVPKVADDALKKIKSNSKLPKVPCQTISKPSKIMCIKNKFKDGNAKEQDGKKICEKKKKETDKKCDKKEVKVCKEPCPSKVKKVECAKEIKEDCGKKSKPPKQVCEPPKQVCKPQKEKKSEEKVYRSKLQECKMKPCMKTIKMKWKFGKAKEAVEKENSTTSTWDKKKEPTKKTDCESDQPKKVENSKKCQEPKKSVCKDTKPEPKKVESSKIEKTCKEKEPSKKVCPAPKEVKQDTCKDKEPPKKESICKDKEPPKKVCPAPKEVKQDTCKDKEPPKKVCPAPKEVKQDTCKDKEPKKVESSKIESTCKNKEPPKKVCPTPKEVKQDACKSEEPKKPVCQDKQATRPKEPICNFCPVPKEVKQDTCKEKEPPKKVDCSKKEDTCKKEPPKKVESSDKCEESKKSVCQDIKSKKASEESGKVKTEIMISKTTPPDCSKTKENANSEPKKADKAPEDKKCAIQEKQKGSSSNLVCLETRAPKIDNERDLRHEEKCVDKNVKTSSPNLLAKDIGEGSYLPGVPKLKTPTENRQSVNLSQSAKEKIKNAAAVASSNWQLIIGNALDNLRGTVYNKEVHKIDKEPTITEETSNKLNLFPKQVLSKTTVISKPVNSNICCHPNILSLGSKNLRKLEVKSLHDILRKKSKNYIYEVLKLRQAKSLTRIKEMDKQIGIPSNKRSRKIKFVKLKPKKQKFGIRISYKTKPSKIKTQRKDRTRLDKNGINFKLIANTINKIQSPKIVEFKSKQNTSDITSNMNQTPISTDVTKTLSQSILGDSLCKPRAFNLDDDGEIFMCKIEKLTDRYNKCSRTLKCKLVKDDLGREVFVCKDMKDEFTAAKLIEKTKPQVLSANKSKSSSDIPTRSISSRTDDTITDAINKYLQYKPVCVARKTLEKDIEQMKTFLERYTADKSHNEDTKKRIYRVYLFSKKLLNKYYEQDKKNNNKVYFDYKDIVTKERLKQILDNQDILKRCNASHCLPRKDSTE